MKKLTLCLLSFLMLALFPSARAALAPAYSYVCGKDQKVRLDVLLDGRKVVIYQRFASRDGRGIINIYSDPVSNPRPKKDPEVLKQISFKSYISFMGFHFPKHDMYVTDEQETNEAGYTLILEPGILQGAQVVAAAEQYWSDWHDSSFSEFSCLRVK